MSAVGGEKQRRWQNLWQGIFVGIELPLKKLNNQILLLENQILMSLVQFIAILRGVTF
jgi:hypothetical protein